MFYLLIHVRKYIDLVGVLLGLEINTVEVLMCFELKILHKINLITVIR